MKRLSLSTFAVVLVASLLLAACGSTPTPEPVGQAAGITVVDALGRTVEFAEPPQRIVVAGRSSLTLIETLYLFAEAKDRVEGIGTGKQNPGDFLAFVDPTFEDKSKLAPDVGPEQIAPLNPDVVIVRSFMAESLGMPLEELDIPVVYLDLETPEQYFRDVGILGQLFGNEARAEEIKAFYQERLDKIDSALQGLGDSEKPRALVVQYSDQGGEVALNVPSATWLQTIEAELAGATPVWVEAAQAGGWTVVNFEQIAAWDPDKIFVIHYAANASDIVDQLEADPQWQALRAVQAGEIYGFAGDIYSWDQPDPRWILGVTWLAERLHPEQFADLDMKEEASLFFQEMYGMDAASVQEQILSKLKGDVQ